MSSVTDKLFGSTDTYGMDVAAENRRSAEEFIKQQAAQGRQDIISAIDPMTQSIQQGYQKGADIYSYAIPQQLAALRTGAQEAQRMRMGALPSYQYALMGVPFNIPQMLSQTRPVDVPAYQDVPSMGQPQVVQAASRPDLGSDSIASMLAGIFNTGGSSGGGYGGGVGGSDFANGQRIN
jgi:hypothetical protein